MNTFNKIGNLLRADNLIRYGKKKLYPLIGSVIGEGLDIAKGLMMPMYLYEDKIDKVLNYLHSDLAGSKKYKPPTDTRHTFSSFPQATRRAPIIYPNPNAGFGIGDKGSRDLAPANIGDRQETLENKEKIIKNNNKIFFRRGMPSISDNYHAFEYLRDGEIIHKPTEKLEIKEDKPIKKGRRTIHLKENKIIKREVRPISKLKGKSTIHLKEKARKKNKLKEIDLSENKPGNYVIEI